MCKNTHPKMGIFGGAAGETRTLNGTIVIGLQPSGSGLGTIWARASGGMTKENRARMRFSSSTSAKQTPPSGGIDGAAGETRTPTILLSLDFESSASTSSATAAGGAGALYPKTRLWSMPIDHSR